MEILPTTAVILLGTLSGTAYAGDMHGSGHQDHAKSQPAAMSEMAMPLTDGVIRAIDRDAGTITVEHGPIKSLGMPAMTMPYHVKDRSMLTAVKPGDRIKMSVDKMDDLYTITTMQRDH
ncbi:MAG: copper-binding protein [Steroidobacteraceae bacterium]|nr:copper-binding protein [Steroidobacteraceae bacterium]